MDLGKQFRIARRKAQLPEDLVLYCARHDYGTRVLSTTGNLAAMALYAGQSVGAVTRVQPAAEIVREVAEEAERLLRKW